MKKSAYIRFSITLLLLISLVLPVGTLAVTDNNGAKKHFNQGMKHEVAEEWDKAVEEFAAAVAKNPKNPEYRLHLVRALFNASQMYMKRGATHANEKDYVSAYNAFRRAYNYDPTNELAKSEMERMLRLQQEALNGNGANRNNNIDVRIVPADYNPITQIRNPIVRRRLENVRDFAVVNADLVAAIKDLAERLELNVLFENSPPGPNLANRKLTISLKNVTDAKILDYIFLQENLFFQRVGPKTILVTDANRRPFLQQLVLRTFYLANAKPADVQKVIQAAIPPQPGRVTTQPLIDEATNSITVRDTSENIKIIESLIRALDKDRAEVVMDVAIYEVTKSDLLQIGNQIGTEAQLTNLGGVTNGVVTASDTNPFRTAAGVLIPQTIGVGVLVPAVSLAALQKKNNTKLVASTQIHAFNNEDSSARIGQRVPVRTAQIQSGLNNNSSGFVSDVINYEQVGLTLKFKPIVFPNQDVQVTMEIESKNVAGAQTLTPTFTERTIKGTARIQNNKTLLLASVAQGSESNGRQGLPLLGLIPILGRLFTAPTKDNQQVDVVIAVTPRVIRAPAILPQDEVERPTGSQSQPTNSSLEAMMIQEAIDEQVMLARQNPTNADIQLPDQPQEQAPVYVQSNNNGQNNNRTENATENNSNAATPVTTAVQNNANVNPVDTTVRTLNLRPTADTSVQNNQENNAAPTNNEAAQNENRNAPSVQLQILPTLSEMKKGEKTKIAILTRSATPFRSAVLGLKFDKDKLAVRSVAYGELFGAELSHKPAMPFLNENGKMFVSLSSPKDTPENSSGILAYVEIEALADGKPNIAFEGDILNFLTADGKNFTVRF